MDQTHDSYKFFNKTIPSFPYQDYGVKGVGKYRIPILTMDQYRDQSKDLELHIECCKGLALSNNYKMGMTYGSIPPEESNRLFGALSWTDVLKEIKSKNVDNLHLRALEEIADLNKGNELQSLYKYAYFALGAAIPWFFALYLKKAGFSEKTSHNENYTEDAAHFPKLLEYINTLPFKAIGRILFFTSYPNSGVVIHRDSIVAEHKDHNINLFFDGGWRPSFIWDEVNKKKIYLSKGSKSYFFNNRDYHGVDPEPHFRYTLRIDGTFTDELCDKLGLENGYTWKWDYEN